VCSGSDRVAVKALSLSNIQVIDDPLLNVYHDAPTQAAFVLLLLLQGLAIAIFLFEVVGMAWKTKNSLRTIDH
jgi:hypothetical protein